MDKTKWDARPKEYWVESIAAATQSAGIEWMPGPEKGKLTHRRVVRLVGLATATPQILEAPVGSLKRAALVAEANMERASAEGRKRAKRRKIDFGEEIPFQGVPKLVQEGFDKMKEKLAGVDELALEHYSIARMWLILSLGDPKCDVMLMLTLTVCASSATPRVLSDQSGFSVAERPQDPAILAANMVTRMMWFLRPEEFSWGTKEERPKGHPVPVMSKKIGE
jgi:hypothetical protein